MPSESWSAPTPAVFVPRLSWVSPPVSAGIEVFRASSPVASWAAPLSSWPTPSARVAPAAASAAPAARLLDPPASLAAPSASCWAPTFSRSAPLPRSVRPSRNVNAPPEAVEAVAGVPHPDQQGVDGRLADLLADRRLHLQHGRLAARKEFVSS